MAREKKRNTQFSQNSLCAPPEKQDIPYKICLNFSGNPGVLFGLPSDYSSARYVGMSQGTEGNISVIGGNGSGKSAGIAKPTLKTWQGPICATDVKGELSDFYKELCRRKLVSRPYIKFDPMQADCPSYDPFWLLSYDREENLLNNIKEIAMAIAPISPDDKQPFWAETEQGILAAAILYYFELRLSFSETMCKIASLSMSELCSILLQSGDVRIKVIIGEVAAMKPETLANFDRGLRNKIMLFAVDPYISHAFRGQREGANCFSWEDLDEYNIFLCIPADKIEQWSGAVNLMYTQLIRHLERRPEKYSEEYSHIPQTLLLMDEFARFGKLEMITSALATLRSKNVNICLIIQSVAQLDKIYGEYDRRIIFDNFQFQAILRANDAGTQRYLCELIGTHMSIQRSMSEHKDEFLDTTGYNSQISETRDWVVQPHELSTLDDVLLLTPYGFGRVKKFRLYDEKMKSMLLAAPQTIRVKAFLVDPDKTSNTPPIPCTVTTVKEIIVANSKKNEGAKIMSVEERIANADKRINTIERKKRQEERAAQEAQRKKDQRRNFVIGELVAKYFPEVSNLEPGTDAENRTSLDSLEAFLYVLSTDYELVGELRERAAQLLEENPEGQWRSLM